MCNMEKVKKEYVVYSARSSNNFPKSISYIVFIVVSFSFTVDTNVRLKTKPYYDINIGV